MVQQMADGHHFPIVRQLRDVCPDIVFKVDSAVQSQKDRGRGGKLLGDRSGFEDGLRGVWHAVLQLRHPVSSKKDRVPILTHPYNATRGPGVIEGRKMESTAATWTTAESCPVACGGKILAARRRSAEQQVEEPRSSLRRVMVSFWAKRGPAELNPGRARKP